jgi:hypothetical protein
VPDEGTWAGMDTEKLEAIQNVVDRVSAYQDGATEGTVEKELREGLDEAGIELDDQEVGALTSAIEENPAEARAADVLG